MACERWREMLSAQLDGEDEPAARELVEGHLAGCAGCREWLDRAAAVNRLTRTGVPVPDLGDRMVAALLPAGTGDPNRRQPGVGSARRPTAMGWPWPRRMAGGWLAPAVRLLSRPGWPAGWLRPVVRVLSRPGWPAGWLRPVVRVLSRPGSPAGRAGWWGPALGRRFRPAALLFLALAAVGAVQLILGLDQIGGAAGAHLHAETAATGHLWHESAAWNVAVGAGYLFIALRRSRPGGLVPMLTAFVGMLLLLSVNDLTGARVDGTRLVSHGFVIVGYLLVVALSRVPGGFATPPGARVGGGSGWRLPRAEGADEGGRTPARPGLRLVPRPMTAEHDERAA